MAQKIAKHVSVLCLLLFRYNTQLEWVVRWYFGRISFEISIFLKTDSTPSTIEFLGVEFHPPSSSIFFFKIFLFSALGPHSCRQRSYWEARMTDTQKQGWKKFIFDWYHTGLNLFQQPGQYFSIQGWHLNAYWLKCMFRTPKTTTKCVENMFVCRNSCWFILKKQLKTRC